MPLKGSGMPRYIDLEDYDFREIPGGGELARLGDSPTVFKQQGQLLRRERRRVAEEFKDPRDPFVLQDDEDDSWGTSILTLDDVEQAKKRGITMGATRLRAREGTVFAKPKPRPTAGLFSRFASAVGRAAEAVGEKISEAGEAVGEAVSEAFDPANIPGTSENLQMGTMKLLDRALKPAWVQMYTGDANNPSLLELHRRIKDFLASTAAGRMPQWQASAPAGRASQGASKIVARYGSSPGMGWVGTVSTALQLAQGFIQGQYADRAKAEMKKIDMDSIKKAIGDSFNEFTAAGALPPQPGEQPPADYVPAFQTAVRDAYQGPRVKGDKKKRPKSSWWYQYIKQLGADFKAFLPQLKQAKNAMQMSINAYNKTTMPKTVQACGQIASRLFAKGVISKGEIGNVVSVLHKHFQGYVLDDVEQALLDRIEPHITGSTGKKLAAGVGAAAAVTALLTMI